MDDYKDIIRCSLIYYMDKNNKIQNDLIHDLGLSSSVISSWCRGYRTPSVPNLQMLANYFGIDIIDFFVKDKNNLSEIIKISNKLDEEYREVVKKHAESLLNIQNK